MRRPDWGIVRMHCIKVSFLLFIILFFDSSTILCDLEHCSNHFFERSGKMATLLIMEWTPYALFSIYYKYLHTDLLLVFIEDIVGCHYLTVIDYLRVAHAHLSPRSA